MKIQSYTWIRAYTCLPLKSDGYLEVAKLDIRRGISGLKDAQSTSFKLELLHSL